MLEVVNSNWKCKAPNGINHALNPLADVAVPTARTAGQLIKRSFVKSTKFVLLHPASVVQNLLYNLLGHRDCTATPVRWHTLQSSPFNLLFPRVKIWHKFKQKWGFGGSGEAIASMQINSTCTQHSWESFPVMAAEKDRAG